MCRSVLALGELGSHRGLPVSIVVTTTLQELESAAGIPGTGGGKLAADARGDPDGQSCAALSAFYDQHTGRELHPGETKRIASAAQRIVLHAKDRGCTRPGCTALGYRPRFTTSTRGHAPRHRYRWA